ncbi:hypothetical protein [Brevundimonas sp.]|uniref:hypothetical protein n=1 Tax=Brevundimonas sp. TaxID=1871086 RepID=UPI001D29C660|nr:hypothetical protein [Brevundimonas sp.]MBA4000515.1 hypothetical protein [Brevundimonas sp.]
MNAALEPDGPAAGFQVMFKRKNRQPGPAIDQADSPPLEEKVFNNTDGSISMSRPQTPDEPDDFGGSRLNAPPASLGTAPQPTD